MLTCVQYDGCVHGELNHAITVTTRLSGSNPNLQNIPKEGKSDVKKTFISRFKDGVVAEIDYRQLEVVCKAVLSGDENLMEALRNKLDQHCEWLGFATNLPYDEVLHRCKVLKDPVWIKKRQDIKSLTFSEAYGAGIAHMAEQAKLPADVVKAAMNRRKEKYPKLYEFDDKVMESVQSTRRITNMRTEGGYQRAVGYYKSPTCTLFHFLEGESLPWQQDQGIHTAFQPTRIKNYPPQGLGGEVMQVQNGRLVRELFKYGLRDKIKMINTVHDSVYLDFYDEETALKYLPAIAGLLEDVSMYFSLLYTDVAWTAEFPVDVDYGDNIMEVNNTVKERSTEWITD